MNVEHGFPRAPFVVEWPALVILMIQLNRAGMLDKSTHLWRMPRAPPVLQRPALVSQVIQLKVAVKVDCG